MRVLVISDTHGRLDAAINVLKKEEFDLILHAGDFFRDTEKLAVETNVPIHGVVGNCDQAEAGPTEGLLTLEGKKILLIHGHQFRVKSTCQRLFYRACQEGADVVVFGHTHVPLNKNIEGILLFNPGSPSRPQPGHSPTYGILEIDKETVKGYIYKIIPEKGT